MLHLFRRHRRRLVYCCLAATLFQAMSCRKATVNFGEEALNDDPNIIYIDTLSVALSTFQADSLYTAGDTLFIAGTHLDSLMGGYTSKAYMQLGAPSANPLSGCNNCTFDSLVFTARFSGASYGDTTDPFTLQVHRLTERMIADETSIGYNTSNFSYEPEALGSATWSNIAPSQRQIVSVRLKDALGMDLMNMLKRNSDTVTNSATFSKYFNGLVLTGSAARQNSIYYFTQPQTGNSIVMQLYYRQNGVTPVPYTVSFPISPASYQFNAFSYDHSGTPLASVTPQRRLIIPSAQTGNRIYLHANSGLHPHFHLNSLLALKELHPYVKVISATLEITPPLLNYAPGDYYTLPPSLALYSFIDDSKTPDAVLYSASGLVQTGSLVTDLIYHQDTRYTYDLTAYVNKVLSNGLSAERSFLMMPLITNKENRLILNAAAAGSSAKLKLYVLGL